MGNISSAKTSNNLVRFITAKSDNLLPRQQQSAEKLLRSADCYQQKFIKFPHLGIFHSYAELLHAALLESDCEVESFTPQPFMFRLGKARYVPDCYLVKNGKRIIVELKPKGELSDDKRIPVEEFCRLENMTFEVISNESVLQSEQRALNWLKIIRVLISATEIPALEEEHKIYDRLFEETELELGDIVFKGDRIGQKRIEIALFRLAHKGIVKLSLDQHPLSYTTMVKL